MKKFLTLFAIGLLAVSLHEAQAAKDGKRGGSYTRPGTKPCVGQTSRNVAPRTIQRQEALTAVDAARYQQAEATFAARRAENLEAFNRPTTARQLQVTVLAMAFTSLALYYTTAHPQAALDLVSQSSELATASSEKLAEVWQFALTNASLKPLIEEALALFNATT
jgi:hypothetical protein